MALASSPRAGEVEGPEATLCVQGRTARGSAQRPGSLAR